MNTAYFPIYFINTFGRQKLLVTGLLATTNKGYGIQKSCAREVRSAVSKVVVMV